MLQSRRGLVFERVGDVEAALNRLWAEDVDLVIAHLPESSWEGPVSRLLARLAQCSPPIPAVAITDADDPALRLRLLQAGAVDCLTRPLDLSRLAFLIEVLTIRVSHGSVRAPRRRGRMIEGASARVGDFLFASDGGERILETVQSVAALEATVLLTGETGTGKTHLARVIHEISPRRTGPFAVVQCGALSASLFESELFGHVRGAFTGADHDSPGRFAEAQGGTVLLDDIDGVPWEAQSKLLRAVEERVYEPVGSSRSKRLRARLIVATNRSLEDEVAAGRFRGDLYHRLNVIDFCLTPLRESPGLLRPLAQKFLGDMSGGRRALELSDAALAALEAYHWPGNARELRNVLKRAAAFSHGSVIDLDALPERVGKATRAARSKPSAASAGQADVATKPRGDSERRLLIDTLHQTGNNRTRAALELGISRVTLYKKLHRYGLI